MRRTFLVSAALTLAVAGGPSLVADQAMASRAVSPPQVLLVCNGSTAVCPALGPGDNPYYTTVQSAVDAANPGDWILIYAGVYHEKTTEWPTAGVWIDKANLHIRGMNRNQVIIDGSNGTAAHPCPSDAAEQDFTARDGIEVWKASGVTIQNLTVCDYLSDASSAHGNEIWWNGGDGSGQIGLGSFSGSYLTATSEYGPTSSQTQDLGQYGIFVSNSDGPGQITNSYASNMADAAYYVGGCGQVCNTTLASDIGTNSALGYSGTNSGGSQLVVKNSLFTLNHAGVVPNSMNSEDPPPPQSGMVIENNVISNNNNVNAPAIAFTAPVGIGVQLAGGQYDTVTGNVIKNQGSWGVATTDAPDGQPPAPGANCQGGIQNDPAPGVCDFPALGNLVYGNTFSGDGFFGNPTNSDLATETLASYSLRNCFYGNQDQGGTLTSEPANIQKASVDGKPCSQPGTGFDALLGAEMECALSAADCPLPSGEANYPQEGPIVMLPVPQLANMPEPCDGVPINAFCSS